MDNKITRNTESGNAIFLIIMGVALFAALGYAFTSSNRTSTTLVTDEQASTYANKIIAYGNEIKQAVRRLQLRGCDDTEISFENDVISGYENPNAPTSKKCHVFDIAGGGLNWKSLNTLDIHFVNGNAIENVGTDCADENCTELMLIIRLNQTASEKSTAENICNYINRTLGNDPTMTNTIFRDDTPNALSSNLFIGEYHLSFTNDIELFNGKKSYCGSVDSNIHSYHHVLITR